ncbi:MAG: glycosyl transferase family 28, partial [Pseudomonadota bacterium]
MSTSSPGSDTDGTLEWVRRTLDARADPAQPVRLWWRDDDAVTVPPRHDAVIGAFETAGIDPLIAVIPAALDDTLADRAARWPAGMAVAVHGFAHINHAPKHDKKAEFGAARSADAVARDLATGWARIEAAFGQRALPVFVPPWNRIAPQHVARLARAGFGA